MEGWNKVKLSEVADLRGGFAFKSKDYSERGMFVLRTVNITDQYNIDKSGAAYIPNALVGDYERFLLRPLDTLFVMVGATLGKIGIVRESDTPALLNQNMWRIRAIAEKIDPLYLHYVFRVISKIPISWASGSARGFVRRGDYRDLEFLLPPKKQQEKIATILGAIDDKIELNRRMNATLEAQVRALFRDWFVDFGPTCAKMAGATPYLPADLWALFPDKIGEDGLPEGWEMKTLSSQIKIIGGGTPKTSVEEYWSGTIPWFSVKDTPSGSDLYVFETEKSISTEGLNNSSATIIPKGATIVSARGTVGNLALAGREMTFNQSCYGILPKESGNENWVFFATRQAVEALQSMAHGSVFSTITRSTFDNVHIPDFKSGLRSEFDRSVSGLLDRIESNGIENAHLAKTRDYLLPRLMSGEVSAS